MKKSLKILFFGNERIATGINSLPLVFQSLLDSPHEVVGLVIHSTEGTGRIKRSEPIVELANAHNIPILNPSKLAESTDDIRAFGADCGVLVAYGKIIPDMVISLFPKGILNLHPSLLPELRGSTPIETAILDGRGITGVSIMSLTAEMDTGPVYSQRSYTVPPNISKSDLASYLHALGAPLILSTLDTIANSTQKATEQNHHKATYTTQIKKEDGLLDWNKPAKVLSREIRAYSGWPKSYFTHNDAQYVVIDADASDENISDVIGTFVVVNSSTLGVQTAAGSIWLNTLQPAGKKEMPVQAFLNGYSSRF